MPSETSTYRTTPLSSRSTLLASPTRTFVLRHGQRALLVLFCLTLPHALATAEELPPVPLQTNVQEDIAASSVDPARTLRFDVETDPIAFVLGGYSLHLGLGAGRVRTDLGVFAIDVPEAIHGNSGVDMAIGGFGAKVDVFLRPEWRGPFLGVEASTVRVSAWAEDAHERRARVMAGGRAGWRFALPLGLHVTPWVGVGVQSGTGERSLGETPYKESPLVIFPTVHVGWSPQG